MNLLTKCFEFTRKAHAGQTRKYSNDPYIVHPVRVSLLASEHGMDTRCQAAALLHDTIEDCGVSYAQIVEISNEYVANLVSALTNYYTKEDFPWYNRQERKLRELERLRGVSKEAKQLKMLDRLDNLNDFGKLGFECCVPADFIRLYFRESEGLVSAIGDADPIIKIALEERIKAYNES